MIHTVGPGYAKTIDHSDQLRSCYTTSLAVADVLGAGSVAFPLVSSGIYGWPKDDAIRQALRAIRAADTKIADVTLVLYDAKTLDLAERIAAE